MVQVYTQESSDSNAGSVSWDDDGPRENLQLLNEVGAGGTLSSLFTILSLFTEDVQISWPDVAPSVLPSEPPNSPPVRNPYTRGESDVSHLNLDGSNAIRSRFGRRSSVASTVHAGDFTASPSGRTASPLPLPPQAAVPRDSLAHRRGVVARAAEDSTLAVIPAEVFHRLTKKFPKATSHIVQGRPYSCFNAPSNCLQIVHLVILTRFSRVTFNAAHKYLGLTSEVLRTEKAINDIAYQPLPRAFYEGGGLRALRQRFDTHGSPDAQEHQNDYFSSSSSFNDSPSPATPMVFQLQSDDSSDGLTSSPRPTIPRIPSMPLKTPTSRYLVQAGDLLTSTDQRHGDLAHPLKMPGLPRTSSRPSMPPAGAPIQEESINLKEEVMSCIAKSIGLLQPPLSTTDSLEASPLVWPEDARNRSPLRSSFSGSIGSLSLLDLADDTASSIGSTSVQTPNSYMSGLDNEVEILFFQAGSVLTKTGDIDSGEFSNTFCCFVSSFSRTLLCYRRFPRHFPSSGGVKLFASN